MPQFRSVQYKSNEITLGSRINFYVETPTKSRLTYDPDNVQNSPAAPSLTAPSSVPAASGLWRQDSG
jgi:hypothetical protein